VKQENIYESSEREILENCTLCPRECHVNRFEGGTGYCGIDAGLNIASICIHRGEEPPVSGPYGICNVFFAGCNLHCLYCQNHQISQPVNTLQDVEMDMNTVLDKIEKLLSEDIIAVGFVSPSHMVPQVKAIIRGLKNRRLDPVIVYNTNGYDKLETIRDLTGIVDVFLPDYKYFKGVTALEYSDAIDYPEIALRAIKEMYYQKGSTLAVDDKGRAENGLVIRHLVLPGHEEESKDVLLSVAEEISPGVHISLMSQYHPVPGVENHSILNREIYESEYESVVQVMEQLGFRNGWVQYLDSVQKFRPDFSKENPFE